MEIKYLCNLYLVSYIEVGDLVYKPPRDGPTLWEIGIPDRAAAEFFVPDPDPKYNNKLFINHPDRLAIFVLPKIPIYIAYHLEYALLDILKTHNSLDYGVYMMQS